MTRPDPQSDAEPVATGDRRDDVRLEPDPDQLVRMRATFKVDEPPAPEMTPDDPDTPPPDPGVTDVAVAKPSPSAWDARPADAPSPSDDA